jgi:hypothetical protein
MNSFSGCVCSAGGERERVGRKKKTNKIYVLHII